MSKAGGEAAADGDKKYVVSLTDKIANMNHTYRFYSTQAKRRC